MLNSIDLFLVFCDSKSIDALGLFLKKNINLCGYPENWNVPNIEGVTMASAIHPLAADRRFALGSEGSVEQTLSPQDISEKISSIDAVQIGFIADKVVAFIWNQIGSIRKAQVDQQVMQKSDQVNIDPRTKMMTLADMKMEQQSDQFFSKEDAGQFLLTARSLIALAITDSFSKLNDFLEAGLVFHISDYELVGFLKEAAEKTGIPVNNINPPVKYFMSLELDKDLTKKRSDLVFAFIETSDGLEFSRKTLTIRELEHEFSGCYYI